MRVAVTQPNYLPWLGYFELLDQVDVWVSLDNVDLPRRSFVVRNRVKLLDGSPTWLSLRVASCPRGTSIRDARLADREFATRHLRVLRENYREARFLDAHMGWLDGMLIPCETSVAAYNERVVRALAERLGVGFAFRRASQLVPDLRGTAQEKIFRVLDALETEAGGGWADDLPDGAARVTAYHNFATGVEEGLYRAADFADRGVRLLKQAYDHPAYLQTGADFLPYLSVVDVLLNMGPDALEVIRKGRRWVEVASDAGA